MSAPAAPQGGAPPSRPKRLLTQNREMKAIGVWNWTLPAWAGRLPDGRTYNTCPSAGICAQVCYARNGSYLWPVVRAKHQANLMFVLDDLPGWETAMTAELGAHRFHGAWIRIRDSGDFFTDDYLRAWLRICHARPGVNFYAYTKEIDRFRRLVEPDSPANFLWVYSYGGTQDHHLHAATDRVADVFPDEDAITAAGWSSQEASDLLAVLGPRLVGIPANRIPQFLRRLHGRRFSQWQAEADAQRADRRHRRGDCDSDTTHARRLAGQATGAPRDHADARVGTQLTQLTQLARPARHPTRLPQQTQLRSSIPIHARSAMIGSRLGCRATVRASSSKNPPSTTAPPPGEARHGRDTAPAHPPPGRSAATSLPAHPPTSTTGTISTLWGEPHHPHVGSPPTNTAATRLLASDHTVARPARANQHHPGGLRRPTTGFRSPVGFADLTRPEHGLPLRVSTRPVRTPDLRGPAPRASAHQPPPTWGRSQRRHY